MIFILIIAAGRSKIKEVRLVETMDKRQISVFENMLNDILGASANSKCLLDKGILRIENR